MDIVPLIDRIGENPTAALFGLITGIVFGVSAQRSRFCLRAAAVEFARRMMDASVAVWLLTFSTALVWVQGASLFGLMRPEDARMMAVTGSWSGAIIGGLLFGVGMVLARGCSGRLLVLAATGEPALGRLGADLRRGRTDEPARLARPHPRHPRPPVDDRGRRECKPSERAGNAGLVRPCAGIDDRRSGHRNRP